MIRPGDWIWRVYGRRAVRLRVLEVGDAQIVWEDPYRPGVPGGCVAWASEGYFWAHDTGDSRDVTGLQERHQEFVNASAAEAALRNT